MTLDDDFQPTLIDSKARRGISKNYIYDTSEPIIALTQGMRKSGKGVSVFGKASILRKKGLLIMHLWGARSNENLYWAINKNCKEKYEKMLTIVKGFDQTRYSLKTWSFRNGLLEDEYYHYLDILHKEKLIAITERKTKKLTKKGYKFLDGELLHCKCNKAYPILWIVPEYIDFDQDSLDIFNGFYWTDSYEFDQAFEDGKILRNSKELTLADRETLNQGKLMKPPQLRPKPLIKIAKITTPTTAPRKQVFREQFLQIMLQARNEGRVIVQNPSMFGTDDKFYTITEEFKSLPYIMNESGYFMPKSRDEILTEYDESYHKVVIVINELRSVSPSSKLSPEAKSGTSKKAIVDFIPEARHFKTWFLADYQNPEDLYSGVRFQSNYFIVKRASNRLLGKDWEWMFDKIETDRQRLHYFHYKSLPITHPTVMGFLDEKRPRVSELPENKEYVININDDILLMDSPVPDFHLKGSLEDFSKDTGIRWKRNKELAPRKTDSDDIVDSSPKMSKNQLKIDLAKECHQKFEIEKKGWETILNELKKDPKFESFNLDKRKWNYLSNWYNRNKKLIN